jgi:hypothetical protein
MDERDLEAEHAVPGRLVDQLGTCLRKVRESRADVFDLVRDVVHSRASLGEKAADRRVVGERTEKLEPTLADADRRRLHSLLLDARAVFEPGAEEALVRLERIVEILDGEADVVHRAGRLHVAIVCERLAPTMRVSAFALVLTAALLAGCGESKKEAKPNGEASKPAPQVLADAKAAATAASAAHVSGNIASSGTTVELDVSLSRGKGAKGSMSTNGLQFDLVRIGDTAYIRGSDTFYKHFAGPAIAQLLHGKWLKAPTATGRFHSLAPLTSLDAIFAEVSSHHGKLVNDGQTTYRGQQVVAIRDTSDNSKLYVAATGTPYPVAIIGKKGNNSGAITFGDWNKPVSLTAPQGAIDISRLGG